MHSLLDREMTERIMMPFKCKIETLEVRKQCCCITMHQGLRWSAGKELLRIQWIQMIFRVCLEEWASEGKPTCTYQHVQESDNIWQYVKVSPWHQQITLDFTLWSTECRIYLDSNRPSTFPRSSSAYYANTRKDWKCTKAKVFSLHEFPEASILANLLTSAPFSSFLPWFNQWSTTSKKKKRRSVPRTVLTCSGLFESTCLVSAFQYATSWWFNYSQQKLSVLRASDLNKRFLPSGRPFQNSQIISWWLF